MLSTIVTVVLWIVLIAALSVGGAFLAAVWLEYNGERREQRVRQNLHRADAKLAAAAQDAKRQMNQAAGQSWRNPFE